MGRLLALASGLAALAVSPAVAAAQETYHAAPGGSDVALTCPANAPCSLPHAVGVAALDPYNPRVVLGPGDYALSASLPVSVAMTIEGAPGQARPRVLGALDAPLLAVAPMVSSATLRRLEVVNTGGIAVRATNATLEQLVATGSAAGTPTVDLRNATTLRASIVRASGPGADAVHVEDALVTTAAVRGVTALGTGENSAGLSVAGGTGATTATVTNSILRGAGADVELSPGESGTLLVAADHSNLRGDTIVAPLGSSFTNLLGQSADPQLDAAGRETAASPTVDAGLADPLAGTTDVDGEARTQGAAIDIGADERAGVPADPIVPVDPGGTPPGIDPPGVGAIPGLPSITLPVLGGGKPVLAGRPTTLTLTARDPDDPVNGVIVDLGPGEGTWAHSACRTGAQTGAFAPGRSVRFDLPITLRRPGVHTIGIQVLSGGCDQVPESTRSEIVLTVQPPSTTVRAVLAAAAASCRDADLVPTARTLRRAARATACLLNAARAAKRLPRARTSPKLARAGAAHLKDMLARRYYAHSKPPGPDLIRRLRKARYTGGAGENLGLGSLVQATPRALVTAWLGSPLHLANVMTRRYRAVGVAITPRTPIGTGAPAATYAVLFGTKR